MLPDNNLPTLLGINPDADAIIAAALGGELSLGDSLARLSPWFLVRAWFSRPVQVWKPRRINTWVEEHLFRYFFISTHGRLCYAPRRNPRKGFIFNETHLITKLEFISESTERKNFEFKSFEDFRKKFDTRFIKEEQILKLWNGTSGQHGGKYNKKDFRKIGKRGKDVMRRFLMTFTNINEKNRHYRVDRYDSHVFTFSERYQSSHRLGRDISICHQTNCPHVFYSTEFHNCGNGRYGIVANEKEFLWLEDD
jgi:hypothetical protein